MTSFDILSPFSILDCLLALCLYCLFKLLNDLSDALLTDVEHDCQQTKIGQSADLNRVLRFCSPGTHRQFLAKACWSIFISVLPVSLSNERWQTDRNAPFFVQTIGASFACSCYMLILYLSIYYAFLFLLLNVQV